MWRPDWFKKLNEARPVPRGRVTILALSMSFEDRFLLERLGKRYGWELRFTYSPREGFNLASQRHFELILCDRNQPGYPWREVMERFAACFTAKLHPASLTRERRLPVAGRTAAGRLRCLAPAVARRMRSPCGSGRLAFCFSGERCLCRL